MALALPPAQGRNITFLDSFIGHALQLPEPHTRKIDLVDGRRERPMQILCLGYSRTGTFSMYTALQMLGYKPYHMANAIKNGEVDLVCWDEGVRAKVSGKGRQWGVEEFDKLTGKCDALLDVPGILFAEELIAAYPDAKVILTERPVEGWLNSMRHSVGEVFSWRRWKYVAWADRELAWPLWRLVGVTLTQLKWNHGDWSVDSPTAKHYLDHYALVRKVCPPDRLLEFPLGTGWGPLCEFLGKEVPEVPYPNINDKVMFVMLHKAILDRATWWAAQKVLAWTVPVIGLVGGVAWYWL